MEPHVSKNHPTPYVPVEIIGGRLVRVCPECRQEIVERTDGDGTVSQNFGEHYETAHSEEEPERRRGYLLALQHREGGKPGPSPEALRDASQVILEMVERQISELDWRIIHRLEDLPDGEAVLQAGQVLRGSWQLEGDDPQLRQVRWYRREQDSLAFTPTKAQLAEWRAACDHARDVRAALIDRHRDAKSTRWVAVPRNRSLSRHGREIFPTNAKSCEPEGSQDLTTRLSHGGSGHVKREPWSTT